MHRLLYLLLIPLLFFLFINFSKNKKEIPLRSVSHVKPALRLETAARLKEQSHKIKNFAHQKGFNTQYAFLVDMKIPSGSNRFFIYDLKKDSIIKSALVTQGYGSNAPTISFSNRPGSYCTSLGKYKIGKSYTGRFGLAYKLYGLDSSNSNAINRFVVLHSHTCVPDHEVAPENICMSQGCPTVSPSFLSELRLYLDNAEKPFLLYIFY
jgi:hypothetical protein